MVHFFFLKFVSSYPIFCVFVLQIHTHTHTHTRNLSHVTPPCFVFVLLCVIQMHIVTNLIAFIYLFFFFFLKKIKIKKKKKKTFNKTKHINLGAKNKKDDTIFY